MTATLDENGVLMILADTPLEAYALKYWSQQAILETNAFNEDCVFRGSRLIVVATAKRDETTR